MTAKPYAFFYGGYMDADVLRAAGTSPEYCEAGFVDELALTIGPIANMEEKEGSRAYGLLCRLSHADLDVLYGGDPAALKGIAYLPEAVLVKTMDGRAIPAITYVCAPLSGEVPDPAYVGRLAKGAEKLGLPSDYLDHIRSFAP